MLSPTSADRPKMPTAEDDARVSHQFARLQILMEDWDSVVEEWVEEHIGAERASVWGIPDTSANPLADLSRQLSTPGLYGKRNTFRHGNPKAIEGLVGPEGLMSSAGYYRRMPFVQYLTLGLGDMLVRWNVTGDRSFTSRLVFPHNVYSVGHPEDPAKPVEIWELRRRYVHGVDEWWYVWEVYDLGRTDRDGNRIKEPSFRIYKAAKGGDKDADGLGEDVSDRFGGALVGEDYPWWANEPTREPVFPWSWYKDADTGQLWNTFQKRGAHRGTLNSALYWTYAGHCARDATGSYVIVAGLHPGAMTVQLGATLGDQPNRNPINGNPPVLTKLLEPGSMEYHETKDGESPFVHEVGPGANLEHVAGFADRYEMKQATRWGLNPSDLSRTAANPSSAAALMVSNQGKREFSDQVEPVFRDCDLKTARVCAIVARAGGLGAFPESGYSVEYKRIPLSSGELKARREELEWQEDQGMKSSVDVYRDLHPGTTEDDAIKALAKVEVDRQRLERATAEALAAAGFDMTTTAPSPPPPETMPAEEPANRPVEPEDTE